MQAFLHGLSSVLTYNVALFVVLSFFLFAKLSTHLGSHFMKLLILSVTTVLLFTTLTLSNPRSLHELLERYWIINLSLTIVLGLHFLGLSRRIKSEQVRSILQALINWMAPLVFGFWLFSLSLALLGPYIGEMIFSVLEFRADQNVELIPFFFSLGLVSMISGILFVSWFFQNKFGEMKFWKILQLFSASAVLIFSVRKLIMIAFA